MTYSAWLQASGVAHLGDSPLKQQVRLYGADGTLEIDVPPFGPTAEAVIRDAAATARRACGNSDAFVALGIRGWGRVGVVRGRRPGAVGGCGAPPGVAIDRGTRR